MSLLTSTLCVEHNYLFIPAGGDDGNQLELFMKRYHGRDADTEDNRDEAESVFLIIVPSRKR